MARRYWPGASPVGKRVRLERGANSPWREVVGVISDVKHWGYDRAVNPEMYLPQKQMVWGGLTFVLAAGIDPALLTATVREQLRAVDPDLPLSEVRTMEQVAARSRAMLYQVSPADPLTLAGVAVILFGTTLLACFVPARRAMRVDPVQALRDS